ncbi:MAG TPA: putative 2OG-Fe(II) oxygenase [Caulobacteraceae bacterium]|jgi:Flp pilus assembly protein TadD
MPEGRDPLAEATELFRAGRGREAQAVLAPAMAAGLDDADAHRIMGLILHSLGDLAGCERELRTVVRMLPAEELATQTLARMLASQGRSEEAADAWQALTAAAPGHASAHYGLAAALYTVGREEPAEAACRRAIALGLDAVEPWVFLGRLLLVQSRLEEAEAAYREAVARDLLSATAQRELAQLIWMRTADVAKARALLDAAPPTADLTAVTVKLLQDAGEDAAAYALAAERAGRDASLQVLAARVALRVDPALCDRHFALSPPWVNPLARAKGEIEADLALGRGAQAVRRADALSAAHPQDHYVTALKAAAWRMAGDARLDQLYDYGRLVKAYRIDAPEGWTSLAAYLADLERALDRLHGPLTHPVGQSLRHGSQTQRSLLDYPDPEIQALFRAIDAPIRRHIAAIGEQGGYEVAGAWSVRLNPSGHHVDHVHPEGWLSSAFYIRLPADTPGREGWIKFGEPGTPTSPPLEPGHWVKPEPGLLVLFPSYMWHGTAPFSSGGTRLTCAFDLVRA